MPDHSLDSYTESRLAALAARNRRRSLVEVSRREGARIETDHGDQLSFACNDYLGLSLHPEVTAAAMAATLRDGAGGGASRLISGNHPGYVALEKQLAAFKGTEDSIVFGSGYLANLGTISALMGSRDLVLLDEYSHSCLRSGAKLSGATTLEFRHNDAAHCAELLNTHRESARHALIATEGVFSMDGDVAPLQSLVRLCEDHDAWLLCDDAHGLGILGEGRGAVAAAGLAEEVPLQTGTLSKALGSYGGFVCASHVVCEYLRNRARSFVYSTALPPGVIAAAGKALEIIAADPSLAAQPLRKARTFAERVGLAKAESAIVPLIVGASEDAVAMSEKLAEQGYFVPAVRPPTVPQGTARLRFAFSAVHRDADVEQLADTVVTLLAD